MHRKVHQLFQDSLQLCAMLPARSSTPITHSTNQWLPDLAAEDGRCLARQKLPAPSQDGESYKPSLAASMQNQLGKNCSWSQFELI